MPVDLVALLDGGTRNGTAVSLFRDSHLFEIDVKRGARTPTPFDPAALRGRVFGMGYGSDKDGLGETLYAALTDGGGEGETTLGYVTSDYRLEVIGPVTPALGRAELTGDNTGQLFALSTSTSGDGVAQLVELDRSNARIVAMNRLQLPAQDDEGFAFTRWGADFWLFRSGATLGPGVSSAAVETVVWRFRPSDSSLVRITMTTAAEHFATIPGAGVSGCMPR